MEKNNIIIIKDKTLDEYRNKFKNRRHRLLKYSEEHVIEFDKQYGHFEYNNKTQSLEFKRHLLNNRKWWLIDGTYYEVPKAPRFTWFRNLNVAIQGSMCLLGAGILATSIAVPVYILTRPEIVNASLDDEGSKRFEEPVFEETETEFKITVKAIKTNSDVTIKEVKKGKTVLKKDEQYIVEDKTNDGASQLVKVFKDKVHGIRGNIVVKAEAEFLYSIDWVNTSFKGEGINSTLYWAGANDKTKVTNVEFVKDSTRGKLCVGEGGENKNPIYASLTSGVLKIWSEGKICFEDNDVPRLAKPGKYGENAGVFGNFYKVESFNFENIDTKKLTDMSYMFSACCVVKNLDLRTFNTSNVNTIEGMFCAPTTQVTPNPSALETVDLSSFDTSHVTNMSYMFENCCKLKSVDISSFDTSMVENFEYMFFQEDDNNAQLNTIYASDKFVINPEESYNEAMFSRCVNLKGGKGTPYDKNHCDGEYARIDDPDNNKPGYFTAKE